MENKRLWNTIARENLRHRFEKLWHAKLENRILIGKEHLIDDRKLRIHFYIIKCLLISFSFYYLLQYFFNILIKY